MNTMNGTIKRLTDKGFGFIAVSDGSEPLSPVRVLWNALRRTSRGPGGDVQRGEGPKGPRAENVRVV